MGAYNGPQIVVNTIWWPAKLSVVDLAMKEDLHGSSVRVTL